MRCWPAAATWWPIASTGADILNSSWDLLAQSDQLAQFPHLEAYWQRLNTIRPARRRRRWSASWTRAPNKRLCDRQHHAKRPEDRNAVHLSGAALRFTGKRVFDISPPWVSMAWGVFLRRT